MDRQRKIRLEMHLWLILGTALIFNSVMADETVNQGDSTNPTVTQSVTVTQSPEKSSEHQTSDVSGKPATGTPTVDKLSIQFPKLQRALISVTIINFIIIIFGLLMYLIKRRMQQFSPASIARLNQEA